MKNLQQIKESLILESAKSDLKKVDKWVKDVNKIIASAVDKDGDPVEVIDSTSTWEAPMVYEPIEFKDNVLKIKYKEMGNGYKWEKKEETFDMNDYLEKGDDSEQYWQYDDGFEMLKMIKRMYTKAIKNYKKEGKM